MEFRGPTPNLFIADAALLDDLYVKKNKYFDKEVKMKNLLNEIIGDSIVFAPSNEVWSNKRKRLSQAFYKDKMIKMLQIVIKLTLEKTESWKQKMAD